MKTIGMIVAVEIQSVLCINYRSFMQKLWAL